MKANRPKPTHRTKCNISMGNQPCWTLPAGTAGTPSTHTTLFHLDQPVNGHEWVYVERHHLERIPTD